MQFSIVCLIPATGWFAVSKVGSYHPLIAWAVIAYYGPDGAVTEERMHGMIFHEGQFLRAEMHSQFGSFEYEPNRATRTIDRARLNQILKEQYHLSDKDIKGHLINKRFELLLNAVAEEDVAELMERVSITDGEVPV